MSRLSHTRKQTIILLLVIAPMGFVFKFYAGPLHTWFNNYGAGLVYEVFWILVLFLFFPSREAVNRIPVGVFAVTCALEVLQLWHPPFLEAIRSHFLGRALIGTTFVWWDFPHYVIGCLLGWILTRRVAK